MVLALNTNGAASTRLEGLAGPGVGSRAERGSTSPTGHSASALAPAHPTGLVPTSGAVGPQPTETELAAATAVVAAVLGDPMALALALQNRIKNASSRNTEVRVRSNGREQRVADGLRLEQLDEVAKKLEKASKKAPPWVKKLIGAVLTAVGTIASVAGGAGAALVAVGAALVIAAKLCEVVLNKLAEAGHIDQKRASITAAVVKVVAAVAAACVGQVGGVGSAVGAVGEAAATAAEIVKTVSEIVQAAATIAFAGVDMHSSVRSFQAQMANIMAEEWGFEVDGAVADNEAAAETFAAIHEAYARMAKIATSALASQDEARLHVARSIA